MIYYIKKFLIIISFFDLFIFLSDFISLKNFNKNKKNFNTFRVLREKIIRLDIKKNIKDNKQGNTFIIFSFSSNSWLPSFPIELINALAIIKSGNNVKAIVGPSILVKKLWKLAGVEVIPIYSLLKNRTDLLKNNTSIKVVFDQLKSAKDKQKLLEIKLSNISLGKSALASLIRKTRGNLEINDKYYKDSLLLGLINAYESLDYAKKIFLKHKPKGLILFDRGYTPQAEFFEFFLKNGSSVIQINAAHNNNFVYKRYNQDNIDDHPHSLSDWSWKKIRNMNWGEQKRKKILDEISNSYSSGEWFSEVGTQFETREYSPDFLIKKLDLDPTKKTAIIFPHILWDATFSWGTNLFNDYEDWLIQTLKTAINNSNLNWIIKIHPANTVKNKRDGFSGKSAEIIAIKKTIGELPNNFYIIDESTKIKTISLYSIVDFCLTVRGTVGIEAACFGKRVLTAGTGRYDKKGFTNDSSSISQYLEKISNLHNIESMTNDEIDLAQKYAYGSFLNKPIEFDSIESYYEKNIMASHVSRIKINKYNEIMKSRDISLISKWLNCDDEDLFLENE